MTGMSNFLGVIITTTSDDAIFSLVLCLRLEQISLIFSVLKLDKDS